MRLRAGLAVMAVAAAWAGTAAAQDVYIRIEAKRGAAAEEAADGWAARFDDVVTFTLPNGMTGIALGPLEPGAASARMAELKEAGEIPQDSFVTAVAGAEPVAAAAAPETEAPAAGPGGFEAALDRFAPGAGASTAGLGDASAPDAVAPGSDSAPPLPEAAAATHQIQLQATPGATAGVELLARWREQFPDAGLWLQPGGWYSIALPAQPEAEAQARLDALIGEGRIPADAFLTAAAEMGELIDAPDNVGEAVADATAGMESPAGAEDAAAGGPEPDAEAQSGETAAAAFESEAVADEPVAGEPVASDDVSPEVAASEGVEGAAQPPEVVADAEDTTANAEAASEGAPAEGTDAGEPAPEAAEDTVTEAPPAPATPAVMPPIEDIQQALRWAGYYDGPIDGISGPGTQAAIEAEIEAVSPGADPAEAMVALLARREAWREELGLWPLRDAETGITLTAPTARLAFDRVEHGLSIYGPKDGSGAALILFAQEGDAAAMSELAGFVTALGWVPDPERVEERNRIVLEGADGDHASRAELRLVDGVVEGFVLIWPAADADNARRLAVEAAESFVRAPVGD
ncbi:peptidoglycan-binding protein [Paracoccus sp. S-4012]|uniref:peptidoglycan-binding domain-containing protein n=1 Tax=Paracoccus sp. S-4012 TaxID=2665648 RepID=UPI0012AFC305|nr:peptidoglycan-binding domain-containing protein [Paracoccus sp. S-4012]MRX50636.1 peptidoglycan-binding protein [Paracoccus sp. S-4012]